MLKGLLAMVRRETKWVKREIKGKKWRQRIQQGGISLNEVRDNGGWNRRRRVEIARVPGPVKIECAANERIAEFL